MSGNEKTIPDFLDSMASQSAALPEPTEVVEPVEKVEEEAPVEKVEPVEKTEVMTPTVVTPKEATMVPLAGLQDEREKRQKAEAERQRLEKELEQYRKQPQEPAKVTDFYTDPEKHIKEVVTQVQQQNEQRLFSVLETEARITFHDYDDVFNEVDEYAKTNPAIAAQVLNAPNPARKAYEIGKQLREYKEMQNPEAYKAKLEAEFRAKWEAEQAAKQAEADRIAKDKADKLDAIPPDLSKTPSATAETRERRSPVFNQLFDKPS